MKSEYRFLKGLADAERYLASHHGEFSLFAACFRENAFYKHWDLVVSASWLLPETMKSYSTIMDGLRHKMEEDEVFALDALPLLDSEDPRIRELQDEYEVEHGLIELGPCQLFDRDMERVYIITAKLRHAPVSAEVV